VRDELGSPDDDVLAGCEVAEWFALQGDGRDPFHLDVRLGRLQLPGPVMNVRPHEPSAVAVEAVALDEEVLERTRLGRARFADAAVLGAEAAARRRANGNSVPLASNDACR
jgi:hypothetical protein